MAGLVVVDASLAGAWVLAEAHSAAADALLVQWRRDQIDRVVPALFPSEINAALLKRCRRGELDLAGATARLTVVLRAVTVRPDDANLAPHALAIADALGLRRAYDSLYVALAEHEGCELWTADERLFNATQARFPYVRLLPP